MNKTRTNGDDLHWVRPRQARSQETFDRILDAAEALVAEKGFDDSSVQEIVRRAGSSVGAFYARFRDKDGLLYALYERYLAEAQATADHALDPARWRGVPLAELIAAVVRFLVKVYRERAGLQRAFALRNKIDPEFQLREHRLSHEVNAKLADLVLERSDELSHPDPERASTFALMIAFSTIESCVLFGETRSDTLAPSDDELAAELTRVHLAYLGVRDLAPIEPAQAIDPTEAGEPS